MFKKPGGGIGFSLNRLVANTVPNFANDNKDDVDLTTEQKDGLFRTQLQQPNPKALDAMASFICRVTDNESNSRKVHSALIKNGCINKDNGLVDTTKVTKKFASQLSMISVHSQRKLVGLLFFWEDELTRWRLIDAEEERIKAQMAQSASPEDRENLHRALQVLEQNRILPPSQRSQSGAPLAAQNEQLPGYSQQ